MGRSRDPTIHSPKMVSWLEDRLGSDLPAQAVAGSPVRQGESHDTYAAPPMGSGSAPHRRGHDNRRVCRGHPRPHDGTLLRRRRQSKARWRRSADVHIAADQWRGFPAQETTVVAVPHVLPSLAGEEDSFRPRHTWPGRQGLVTARTSAAQRDGRRPDRHRTMRWATDYRCISMQSVSEGHAAKSGGATRSPPSAIKGCTPCGWRR